MQQRGVLTTAKRLQPGDVVLDREAKTVGRTLGVQGRKPKTGAPLMRIEFVGGETIRVREDKALRVARAAAPKDTRRRRAHNATFAPGGR